MPKRKGKFQPSQELNKGTKIALHETSSDGSTNHLKPIFNLEHLKGHYCLSVCTTEEKAAFADAIHKRSQMTWGDIQRAPKHGLGSETIKRGALRVQSFPPDLTEDIPILALRFHGNAPMVGYRRGRVFTVLHLDRDFTLYDHG
jgi:hypothetical protein